MLKEENLIFTNLHGFKDIGIKAAMERGDWVGTKDILAKREKSHV